MAETDEITDRWIYVTLFSRAPWQRFRLCIFRCLWWPCLPCATRSGWKGWLVAAFEFLLSAKMRLRLLLVVGTWVGLERVVERIEGTELTVAQGGTAESVEARTEGARTALAIAQDFPLFGTGGGSFYNVFLSYRTPDYGYSYIDHAHNDFVEIATDYGLTGLALLGALVAATLWTVLKVMAKRRSNLPRGIAFGVAMGITALLIHSTVDFNLQIPANGLTIVVILAMGWIAQALPSSGSRSRSSRRLMP